jgi:peptidyl-prolyl cis-trans isomerase SurA
MHRFLLLLLLLLSLQAVAQSDQAPVLIDRIVVIVDEEPILQSEVEREISLYKLEARNAGQEVPESSEELRKLVIDRLVDSKLVIAAAKQADIEVDDDAIERRVQDNIDQLIRYYGSISKLEVDLKASGMTLDDYKQRTFSQLRDQQYNRSVIQRFIRPYIEVRAEEIEGFYVNRADELPAEPDSVTIASILIQVEPSEELQAELQVKLAAVSEKLESGIDFAEVAKELSDGPAATRGGNVGTITPGLLFSSNLEDAVYGLIEGGVSSPVVTERGIHIVKVNSIDAEKRNVSQIFFPITITEEDMQKAQSRAQAAYDKASAGEPFDLIALDFSDDRATAHNGGHMGTFALNELSPTISEAIGSFQTGDLIPPFQTPAGFYILLLKNRANGRLPGLEESTEYIRNTLEMDKMEEELIVYIDKLRDKFVIDYKEF